MIYQRFIAVLAVACLATPVWAEMVVRDAYARAAMPTSQTGAVYMVLENNGLEDDVLIAAASDVAKRVELHTHASDEMGVMRMREIEGGIYLPAGADHVFQRGADHLMLLGLTRSLAQGETLVLTLVFERAGEIVTEVPVDLERMPRQRDTQHDGMDHGAGHNMGH